MNIAFIGLGLMGLPMARNIATKLPASDTLTVWNRTTSKASELSQLGARVAPTLADAVAHADIVITMLTAAADLEEILFGDHAVASHMKKGSILIDMETIGPTAAREIAKRLEKYDLRFADCPVTGSTPGAIGGTLTIFVGSSAEVLKKIKPVLSLMGTNIQHIGEVGSGQAIKLVNNMLIAETLLALGEGMILADVMNLPRQKVVDVLSTTPVYSPMLLLKSHNLVNHTYPTLFSLANMTKDVRLALNEIRKAGRHLPYLEKAVELHEIAVTMGHAAEDNSSVVRALM